MSTEPDTWLEPTNREIMTWAGVRHLTDWTTQVPQFLPYLKNGLWCFYFIYFYKYKKQNQQKQTNKQTNKQKTLLNVLKAKEDKTSLKVADEVMKYGQGGKDILGIWG